MRHEAFRVAVFGTEAVEEGGERAGRQVRGAEAVVGEGVGGGLGTLAVARLDQAFDEEEHGRAAREVAEEEAENADGARGAESAAGGVAGDDVAEFVGEDGGDSSALSASSRRPRKKTTWPPGSAKAFTISWSRTVTVRA
jgi:hypothetical protein